MPGLSFQEAQPTPAVSLNRADVVGFAGFVARRPGPLPADLKAWLDEFGWNPARTSAADVPSLLHTPVPVESFEAFSRLFAWEQRPAAPGAFPHPTWLGMAVRAFFQQGGARCFVVRTGDPGPYSPVPSPIPTPGESPEELQARLAAREAFEVDRSRRLRQLLPGVDGPGAGRDHDPAAPLGLGVLTALDEVAFACLPDLPELVADAARPPAGLRPPPSPPEVFVELGTDFSVSPPDVRQVSSAPACTPAGFRAWFAAARHAASQIRQLRRDMQVILSLPLPAAESVPDLIGALSPAGQSPGLGASIDTPGGLSTAFLQLAFPWLRSAGSEALPGGLHPPDGFLAGIAARSIARRGADRSLGAQPVPGVYGFAPELAGKDLDLDRRPGQPPALIQRVSIIGPSPTGTRVLSDVTTSLDADHRPAAVGRLTAAILRTARGVGDTLVFEPAGPALWDKLRSRLDALLAGFFAAGTLAGASRQDAYSVRCDGTTTTPNDLDQGRVVTEIRFTPAHPIRQITVVLALREGDIAVQSGPV
jgi:hypothetical protein